MTLQLRTRARLLDLHCSVGLTDWDMDKELRLATTTDQMYPDDRLSDQYVVQRPSARASRRKDEFVWYDKMSDTFVKPNLWLLVNPSIACPIQYGETSSDLQTVSEPAGGTRTDPAETRNPSPTEPRPPRFQEGLPGSEYPVPPTHKSPRNRFCPLSVAFQDFKNLNPGCWPRRPVNYCILIALALRSSHSGSLKVQQIYHFTRSRRTSPSYQTAPDGWKNTIRHNLCFNSSFRKTCNQMCRDGKRKSCFWHLTPDGQRRLMDEISTLPRETFRQLERSMSHPVIRNVIFGF
uniref:Forkhead box R1 n=1 Tax=Tetraodon nigroviridis TaxID=99883 RepID=H3DN73_TETNG